MNEEMKYELVKFENENISLDVNVSPKEETIWLSQSEISVLFNKDRKTITRHIQNILKELELDVNQVCSKKEHTANEHVWLKQTRFLTLQKLINEYGYTTLDIS